MRLYLTPAELNETPLGVGLANQISQLSPGVVDKLLARASQRCDTYCRKRIQAPSSTTLSQNATVGATSISVASTLTLDDLSEQAIIIDPLGVREIVQIAPGGVTTTSFSSPYPGNITLEYPGLQYNHSSGVTVQFCYKEVTEAGSSSSSDPYTESLQTQAMQLALAHLPPARTALTRTVFLKAYPIQTITQIEHAFSFVNQFNDVDLSIESVVPSEGWIRFNVGTVVLREGLMRITYIGGYNQVPDDIKTACSYYFAEQMAQMSNPYFATVNTMGKRSQRFILDVKTGKSPLVMQAEDLLNHYRRLI